MIKTLINTCCTNFIGFHLGQKLLKKHNIIKILNINLNIKFITAAKLGEKLKGYVKILKKTRTLVFMNCEIHNDNGLIVSSSGTWKIL